MSEELQIPDYTWLYYINPSVRRNIDHALEAMAKIESKMGLSEKRGGSTTEAEIKQSDYEKSLWMEQIKQLDINFYNRLIANEK